MKVVTRLSSEKIRIDNEKQIKKQNISTKYHRMVNEKLFSVIFSRTVLENGYEIVP